MLLWSVGALSLAAAGGFVLLVLAQAAAGIARLRWPGVVHGLLGIAGFVLLVVGLDGPRRGVDQGAGDFGFIAAGFVAGALLLSLVVFVARMRRRPPSMLAIGVHATLAVGGLVMLAAYVAT